MKLLNKKTIIAILLLLLSFSLHANNDIFSPDYNDDGRATGPVFSRSSGEPTSPSSPLSVGKGESVAGFSAKNDNILNGSEAVDETSGSLSMRYTDLNFAVDGKVNLKLDRIYTLADLTYYPEAYKISSFWTYDLPSFLNICEYSPSPGVKFNIYKALTATVLGGLDKSVIVENAIIVENNLVPVTESGNKYYQGSRTIYIPKTKSLLKIGFLKIHVKPSNSGYHKEIIEMTGVEIHTPEGVVYEMQYADEGNRTQIVKRITDINRSNRIEFNYSIQTKYIYDVVECGGVADGYDYDDEGILRATFTGVIKKRDRSRNFTYSRLESISDSKGRAFYFKYHNNINLKHYFDHEHMRASSGMNCVKEVTKGEIKDYISHIYFKDTLYLTYEITNKKTDSESKEYYIELSSVTRGDSASGITTDNKVKYIYNYTRKIIDLNIPHFYHQHYFYPTEVSAIYPSGGASVYYNNDKLQITKHILKRDISHPDIYSNNKITTYKYSSETKDNSNYLDTTKNYGKTDIYNGYYNSNNSLLNINKKEVYYEYNGNDDDKKVKGTVLSITSLYDEDETATDKYVNKGIIKNNLTSICQDYYVPLNTISYTGKGKVKNEQNFEYDKFGNIIKIDNLTKKVENDKENLYHTTTNLKYLYHSNTNSYIWENFEVYNDTIGKQSDSLTADLILNLYRAVAEATNSIIIKPDFSTDGQSFHAKIRKSYGTVGKTSHKSPLSFNAIIESEIRDNIITTNLKKTTYDYDDRLNKTRETVLRTTNGTTTELLTKYSYNDKNILIQKTDSEGNITEIKAYNIIEPFIPWYPHSRSLTVTPIPTDPSTRRNIFTGSKVITKINYNGAIITSSKEYDINGRLIEESINDSKLSDADQLLSITYTYDDLDRIKTIYNGSRLIKTIKYDSDPSKNTIEEWDAEGNYNYAEYDFFDRIVYSETKLPNQKITSSSHLYYHPLFTDKVTTRIINDSNRKPKMSMITDYDNLGREITKKTNSITISKNYFYDEDNFIISVNYLSTAQIPDREVSFTQINKDWQGNISNILQSESKSEDGLKKDHNKIHTKYEYNGFGNKTKMTLAYNTPEQQEFNYKYNNLGQLLETIYPEGTSEKFEYDNLGQVVKSYDRAGNYSTVEYNSLKLPSVVKFYDSYGSALSYNEYRYNAQGNPLSIIEKDSLDNVLNEYKYTYNRYGYLTNENKVINSGSTTKSFNIGRTYDKLGVPNKLTFATNSYSKEINYILPYTSTSSTPENKNWIKDNLGNNIATYSFNNWGAVDSITYGTSLVTNYSTYDTLLRPVSIVSSNAGVQLLKQTYSYDLTGNVLSYSDGSHNNTYSYDGLNRLLTENDFTYSYDDLNNRTGLYTGGSSFPQLSKSYKYDSFNTNRMMLDEVQDSTNSANNVTYSYDANGNIVKKSQGSTTWDYIYDTQNQLIEVKKNDTSIAVYRYDSNGHRVYKLENNIETYYVYDGNSIIYEESNEVVTPSVISNRIFNVIFNQNNIAKYINDDLQFHLLDNLGSRKLTTDSTGTPINESNLNYSAFGGLLSGSSENYNFTGKQLDTNTGLVYFNARFYDPAIGRFITEDPIKDGLNWYVYCDNNPLKYIDPNGFESYINLKSINFGGTECNPWLIMKNWFEATFNIRFKEKEIPEYGYQKINAYEKLIMFGPNVALGAEGAPFQLGLATVKFENTETNKKFRSFYFVTSNLTEGFTASFFSFSTTNYSCYMLEGSTTKYISRSFNDFFYTESIGFGTYGRGFTYAMNQEGEKHFDDLYHWRGDGASINVGLPGPSLSLNRTDYNLFWTLD